MIKLRSASAVLALSILLFPLAACSTSIGANGCDNKAESGDMLKRLNACETGWVETQRRDDLFAIRTVFKPTSGESCRVWLYPSTGQANKAASYINRTMELRTPAYYHLGRDPFSSLPFIAVSQELGTNCVRSMESALGAQLGTEMERLGPLDSEQTAQESSVCDTPSNTTPKNLTYDSPPNAVSSAQSIDLETNCGTISIALDTNAPKTSRIMTNLAHDGFFDGTKCHELTTSGIYLLQCGDPSGNGTGGPGFIFDDENLPQVNGTFTYSRGTVAMANAGPNTNGSQFFIIYKDSPLPPNYSIWGKVTSGLDLLDEIASLGVQSGDSDGPPKQDVVIESTSLNQ